MKRIIFVTMFFLVFTSFMYLNAQWARTYGGSGNEYIQSIQQTSDEGYIVVGYTYSFDAEACDVWVLKLSSTGEIELQRRYGGNFWDYAQSIQQTSDGGYIVAGYSNSFGDGDYDFWVLKLDSIGGIEWQKTYGGDDDEYAQSIQEASGGGYFVAGYSDSFGDGDYDFWVLKLDSTGGIEWQRTYGGDDNDYALSLEQTSGGGCIVAGLSFSFADIDGDVWIIKLDSTGGLEWQRTYGDDDYDEPSSIQQTSGGGYILGCITDSFGTGDYDAWVLKLDSTGDIDWQQAYRGSNDDYVRSVQETSEGGYIIAGNTISWAESYDAWVLKLSSTGSIEWERTYGGTDYERASSIQEASDGGYIVACRAGSFGAGGYDFLILNLFSDGDIDQSCGFLGTSNAAITYTNVTPESTGIAPLNTDIEPSSPAVTAVDTNAIANLICSAPRYTLTITATDGGTTDPAPGEYKYYEGMEVQIEAIPDEDYSFSKWTGNVSEGQETDNPITITIDSDKSIEAVFLAQYILTIATGTGGTTDPAPGSYTHDDGTEVAVQAIPNSGYQFSGWSGDASGTTNPITIAMNSDKSITASFSATPSDGDGDGEAEGEKKGGCFIATAAYGSPIHSYVRILQDFREKFLMPTKFGRMFVDFYYKYSPFVADLIAKHKVLKVAVRISLLPLVTLSYSMLHLGPTTTAIGGGFIFFVIPIFFVLFYLRRARSNRARIRK